MVETLVKSSASYFEFFINAMSPVHFKSKLIAAVKKFLENFSTHEDALKKIPGTKSERFFSSRLKKISKFEEKKAELLAQIAVIDEKIEGVFEEANKGFRETRERCDGFLSDGEMKDLFG